MEGEARHRVAQKFENTEIESGVSAMPRLDCRTE